MKIQKFKISGMRFLLVDGKLYSEYLSEEHGITRDPVTQPARRRKKMKYGAKRWDQESINKMLMMKEQGKTARYIAEELNRTKSAISARLHTERNRTPASTPESRTPTKFNYS